MGKRGRPPNAERPEVVAADAVIGATAEQLMAWGWTKENVYEVLGVLARNILGRTASGGTALGPDMINKIHAAWRVTYDNALGPGDIPRIPPGDYTREYREWKRPQGMTLLSAAERLLRTEGRWHWAEPEHVQRKRRLDALNARVGLSDEEWLPQYLDIVCPVKPLRGDGVDEGLVGKGDFPGRRFTTRRGKGKVKRGN